MRCYVNLICKWGHWIWSLKKLTFCGYNYNWILTSNIPSVFLSPLPTILVHSHFASKSWCICLISVLLAFWLLLGWSSGVHQWDLEGRKGERSGYLHPCFPTLRLLWTNKVLISPLFLRYLLYMILHLSPVNCPLYCA